MNSTVAQSLASTLSHGRQWSAVRKISSSMSAPEHSSASLVPCRTTSLPMAENGNRVRSSGGI